MKAIETYLLPSSQSSLFRHVVDKKVDIVNEAEICTSSSISSSVLRLNRYPRFSKHSPDKELGI
jgi:hypothetical protein